MKNVTEETLLKYQQNIEQIALIKAKEGISSEKACEKIGIALSSYYAQRKAISGGKAKPKSKAPVKVVKGRQLERDAQAILNQRGEAGAPIVVLMGNSSAIAQILSLIKGVH